MASLTLNVKVGRDLLSMGDLDLENYPAYEVVAGGPGSISWRRQTVDSPYVHGSLLVSAVKDLEYAPLTIRVRGSNDDEVDDRLAVLIQAFSQFAYYLYWDIGSGVTQKKWGCQPADWDYVSTEGQGSFDKHRLMAKMYEVTFNIPRHPQPITGSV